MWWTAQQRLPGGGGRVSRSDSHTDFWRAESDFQTTLTDLGQRSLQIPLNVVSQCLERGNIDHTDLVRQFARQVATQ